MTYNTNSQVFSYCIRRHALNLYGFLEGCLIFVVL
jgi:hypothetical protein